MTVVHKILNYFRKRTWLWGFSAKSSVIILSMTGSEKLLPLIDKKEDVIILDDEHKIYIKYLILSFMQSPSANLKKILFQYYIRIIKAVDPKIIITFVDNEELYWELDKYFSKDLVFLTVQNGPHFVENVPFRDSDERSTGSLYSPWLTHWDRNVFKHQVRWFVNTDSVQVDLRETQ